mmetsp:Transcript_19924/g.50124  ORF Transcript_19924/g.50124 Transcript_19924/m.50124 type:complete len:224 (+) Transcript_19924:201-872(+)
MGSPSFGRPSRAAITSSRRKYRFRYLSTVAPAASCSPRASANRRRRVAMPPSASQRCDSSCVSPMRPTSPQATSSSMVNSSRPSCPARARLKAARMAAGDAFSTPTLPASCHLVPSTALHRLTGTKMFSAPGKSWFSRARYCAPVLSGSSSKNTFLCPAASSFIVRENCFFFTRFSTCFTATTRSADTALWSALTSLLPSTMTSPGTCSLSGAAPPSASASAC